MPVWNGMPYLRPALESILAQTTTDFELLISDNASSDETEDVCREFASADRRVRYVRQPDNLGAAANYNLLVDQAKGEFFKWSAADDILAPRFVADCLDALEQAGDQAVLAHVGTRWIDVAGEKIEDYGLDLPFNDRAPHTRLRTLLGDPVHSHLFKCSPICGLMRTAVLRSTGLIRPYGASDKVCLVEMALRGNWVMVREPHFLRRVHEQSSLNANRNPIQLASWFDPRNQGRYPAPRTTLFKGYVEAVRRAPLSLAEKRRCLGPLFGLLRREWRVLGGEYKIKLRIALGAKPA